MRKKILVILLCLTLVVSGCGMIRCMASTETVNQFETGIVDIHLVEYQKDGAAETADASAILPGDVISKIPRVCNDGNDCYIRTKITVDAAGSGLIDQDLGLLNIGGFSDKWIKADDGYYYYTEILKSGETADTFQWVRYSEDASQEAVQGKSFQITVDVDAIQSKNFTPAFDAAQPWGTVEILKCEKEGQYDISSFKQSEDNAFQVIYEGNTGELVANKDDFFANFPYLMPGDTYSETAKLVNNGNKDIELFFRSEALDTSELLDKIQLKITTMINGEENVIYEGALRAEDIREDQSLGIIPSGSAGDFNFEIAVPAELNNKYTLLSSYVKWIFSVKESSDNNDPYEPPVDPTPTDSLTPSESPEPTAAPTPSDTPTPSESPTHSADPTPTDNPNPSRNPTLTLTPNPTDTPTQTSKPTPTNNPYTGDNSMLLIYSAVFFVSLVLLVCFVLTDRKHRKGGRA